MFLDWDPNLYVFGPPRLGSVIILYGSGSFHQQANRKCTYRKYPVISKTNFFLNQFLVDILEVTDEKSRSENQVYGSKDPDPSQHGSGTLPWSTVLHRSSSHVLYLCKPPCQLSNLFLCHSLQLGKTSCPFFLLWSHRLGDETAVLSCSNRILIQKVRDFTHAETVLGDQVTTVYCTLHFPVVFLLLCRIPRCPVNEFFFMYLWPTYYTWQIHAHFHNISILPGDLN
jgi:hypothetical protein